MNDQIQICLKIVKENNIVYRRRQADRISVDGTFECRKFFTYLKNGCENENIILYAPGINKYITQDTTISLRDYGLIDNDTIIIIEA